jgi:hypothetical protein
LQVKSACAPRKKPVTKAEVHSALPHLNKGAVLTESTIEDNVNTKLQNYQKG